MKIRVVKGYDNLKKNMDEYRKLPIITSGEFFKTLYHRLPTINHIIWSMDDLLPLTINGDKPGSRLKVKTLQEVLNQCQEYGYNEVVYYTENTKEKL